MKTQYVRYFGFAAVLLLVVFTASNPASVVAGNNNPFDGSGASSTIVAYNAIGNPTANCALTVYNVGGTQVGMIPASGSRTIAAGTSASFSSAELNLSQGRYSGTLSCSSGLVSAVVMHSADPAWGNVAGSRVQSSSSALWATTLYATLLANNNNGWFSQLVVYNPNSSATTVYVNYYRSDGVATPQEQQYVPAHGSATFSQDGNGNFAAGYWYSAVVTTSPATYVTAEASIYNWAHAFWMTYPAAASDQEGFSSVLDFPLTYNSWSTWTNSLNFFNPNPYYNTVTVTYPNAGGIQNSITLPPYGFGTLTPPAAIGAGNFTSARASAGYPMIGLSVEAAANDHLRVSRGVSRTANNAPVEPLLMRNVDAYNTAAVCMNLSPSPVNIYLHYSNGNNSPTQLNVPSLWNVVLAQSNDTALQLGDVVGATPISSDTSWGLHCTGVGDANSSIVMDASFAYDGPQYPGGTVWFPIFTENGNADTRYSLALSDFNAGTSDDASKLRLNTSLMIEAQDKTPVGNPGEMNHIIMQENFDYWYSPHDANGNPNPLITGSGKAAYRACTWSVAQQNWVWNNNGTLVYDGTKCQNYLSGHPGLSWIFGNEPDCGWPCNGYPGFYSNYQVTDSYVMNFHDAMASNGRSNALKQLDATAHIYATAWAGYATHPLGGGANPSCNVSNPPPPGSGTYNGWQNLDGKFLQRYHDIYGVTAPLAGLTFHLYAAVAGDASSMNGMIDCFSGKVSGAYTASPQLIATNNFRLTETGVCGGSGCTINGTDTVRWMNNFFQHLETTSNLGRWYWYTWTATPPRTG